ncbi:triose-phosphate isomerase [Vampirovibrio sp.]|uniref:triose-phosphate isomerase n=1 Tax=Vampirovibrio sp. TaxID=2717857 RepID=UPI0035934015
MANARRPVIAGNWKMFKTTHEATTFVESLWQKVQSLNSAELPDIVICPPFTALASVQTCIAKLGAPFLVAAQTMESRDNGAYTGEISPLMLADLGIQWVVLGHSERRQYFNETDETVAQKTVAALKHGITPIVCVGEQLMERENGLTDAVIEQQVRAVLTQISAADLPSIVIAYEPVWAIGTGKVCEAPEANRVCALIRHFVSEYGDAKQTRVLYGGSVKADNTQALMGQSDIDGGLVGGASLEAESFVGIIKQACLVKA